MAAPHLVDPLFLVTAKGPLTQSPLQGKVPAQTPQKRGTWTPEPKAGKIQPIPGSLSFHILRGPKPIDTLTCWGSHCYEPADHVVCPISLRS